MTNVNHTQILA